MKSAAALSAMGDVTLTFRALSGTGACPARPADDRTGLNGAQRATRADVSRDQRHVRMGLAPRL